MLISIILNGRKITEDVRADLSLLDFVRAHGCKSVKCGCETSGCGLCTVFLNETPILSCSLPAVRADGKSVTTLEGLQDEAAEFGAFLADEGAEQCGFCNPGLIMNVIAMLKEYPDPADQEIRDFLAGNLCRCSGYEGQMRAIRAYLAWRKQHKEETCTFEDTETARGTYKEDFAKGLRYIGKPVRKKDAMQLVTGKPVFADDIMPDDCLVIKLKRSPHANAMIRSIDKKAAMAVPGVEAVFTWEDVDQDGKRYTQAGQTWPEPSPYDRLVLDRQVRFAGDVAAIVVADNEQSAEKALKLLKIEYDVLPSVLDYHTAKDNKTLVHPEANWESLADVGADNKRNLCAHAECGEGDIEAVLKDCDIVIDEVYHTKAVQQTMMETFRTWASIDPYGRLDIVSSTQIVFHARRIIANALHIPKSQIRVRKPRIGGGFGAKQTAVSEVYPAFVTWMLKKPSRLIFSREESQTASSPRHEMEVHVRLGAMKDGTIRGIDLYTLSNTGAYGEHGPTTVGLSGHKSIPLYGSCEAFRFVDDVVYTNHMSVGAYRGYGATQGIFAVETAVNELAAKLKTDPVKLRLQNIVHEGERMMGYYGETASSCHLEQCVEKVRDMIGWDEYYPRKVMPDGKIRSVGIGMSMQGSGISSVDVGSASIRLQDDGTYVLRISAADMGTGCDTTLSQIAAEVLECGLDDITVYGADTDTTPYDSGSYASSTAYVTYKAQKNTELHTTNAPIGVQLSTLKDLPRHFYRNLVCTCAMILKYNFSGKKGDLYPSEGNMWKLQTLPDDVVLPIDVDTDKEDNAYQHMHELRLLLRNYNVEVQVASEHVARKGILEETLAQDFGNLLYKPLFLIRKTFNFKRSLNKESLPDDYQVQYVLEAISSMTKEHFNKLLEAANFRCLFEQGIIGYLTKIMPQGEVDLSIIDKKGDILRSVEFLLKYTGDTINPDVQTIQREAAIIDKATAILAINDADEFTQFCLTKDFIKADEEPKAAALYPHLAPYLNYLHHTTWDTVTILKYILAIDAAIETNRIGMVNYPETK